MGAGVATVDDQTCAGARAVVVESSETIGCIADSWHPIALEKELIRLLTTVLRVSQGLQIEQRRLYLLVHTQMRKAIIKDIFDVSDMCDYIPVKCGPLVQLAGVKVIELVSHDIDGVYIPVYQGLGSGHLVSFSDEGLVWSGAVRICAPASAKLVGAVVDDKDWPLVESKAVASANHLSKLGPGILYCERLLIGDWEFPALFQVKDFLHVYL